ncbi:hypothetical protein [Alicyclobacillus sp. SO9]|uniref:hypothetical protein n=1 Tax=Alicyclobacillus sp. SO9 TaxID=2665646 RepID=UPI0018E8755F|nr:hypothetical protein [Alicyclobacillus sp. SO9]QQE79029.1 hypothetical protein GI364_00420 [Alicyclobacillus sp. SO9]
MTTCESDENLVEKLQRISGFQNHPMPELAKERVLSTIHASLHHQDNLQRKRFSWKKSVVSGIAGLAIIFAGTGTVALAEGVNVLNVVVRFVHNITSGSGYGAGYGLEHTAVSLTLKTSHSSSASHLKGASGTLQKAHMLTKTQMMTDGGLFATGYNTRLNHYLGTNKYPKLVGNNVSVSSIQAYSIDRGKDIFYMYVNGYIKGKRNQNMSVDVYHKTGGDVVINGQTLANVKRQLDVSGIKATYVEFTNDKSFLNYMTWKSGQWIFALHSSNVPESRLAQYARSIENQVKTSH